MKIVNVASVPVTMAGAKEVHKQVPISSADGAPTFSFRVFTIEPGGYTPYHTHESEHVNYIIAGTGAIVSEDGEEHPIKADEFAMVLPYEKHRYKNAGDVPFVMICAVPTAFE